jgi:hypothetical protein
VTTCVLPDLYPATCPPSAPQVRRALVPEAAGVRAELYKLNIMTAGGFFKPHKDTPPGGPTCFCSLVVCLPVPFAGDAAGVMCCSVVAQLQGVGCTSHAVWHHPAMCPRVPQQARV